MCSAILSVAWVVAYSGIPWMIAIKEHLSRSNNSCKSRRTWLKWDRERVPIGFLSSKRTLFSQKQWFPGVWFRFLLLSPLLGMIIYLSYISDLNILILWQDANPYIVPMFLLSPWVFYRSEIVQWKSSVERGEATVDTFPVLPSRSLRSGCNDWSHSCELSHIK